VKEVVCVERPAREKKRKTLTFRGYNHPSQ
jgi:hypothetical protein